MSLRFIITTIDLLTETKWFIQGWLTHNWVLWSIFAKRKVKNRVITFKDLFFIYSVCIGGLPLCVFSNHKCAVAVWPEGDIRPSGTRVHRQLWAVMEVLEIKSRPSPQAASSLNHWAIYPAQIQGFFFLSYNSKQWKGKAFWLTIKF